MQMQLMASFHHEWQLMFNQSKCYLARMCEKRCVWKHRAQIFEGFDLPCAKAKQFQHSEYEGIRLHAFFNAHLPRANESVSNPFWRWHPRVWPRPQLLGFRQSFINATLSNFAAFSRHKGDLDAPGDETFFLFLIFFVPTSHFTHRSYLKMSAIQIMARHLFEIQLFNRFTGLRVETELICVASSRMQD